MARPTKQGIDYFPLDTQFDDKVELFIVENGAVSLSVLVTTWQLIYQNEGYFIHYCEDLFLLIKRRLLIETSEIQAILDAAVKRGLFCKTMLSNHKILTSKAIQKRFFIAARKKKTISVVKKYLCNGVSDVGNTNIMWIDVAGNATKEKEKVKEEIKENNPPTKKPGRSDTEAIKIAEGMADAILLRDPGHSHLINGKREKTIERWSVDIEKINRLDGRDWTEIKRVVDFSQKDAFWCRNILSGAKLRKQFDSLLLKAPNESSAIKQQTCGGIDRRTIL